MASSHYDQVIVGAGISGLYLLHRARSRGLSARCFDAASGVGGTWYWNRYPGCRVDIESLEYSYSFSEELQQTWDWSERYAGQPEVLRYLEHVADRFGLRDFIQLRTRVVSAHFDDAAARWVVSTDRGDTVTSRFIVFATGILSEPALPAFEGLEDFAGRKLQSARWPHEPVSFAGERVGVIGTGASGIQIIPLVAKEAAHLTVFQRTPSYTVPLHNGPLDPAYQRRMKARYAEIRKAELDSFAGLANFHLEPQRPPTRSALEVSDEERRREFESRWASGGLCMYNAFTDLLTDSSANDAAGRFVAEKIRGRVKTPGLAEKLIPTTFRIMTRRLPGDTDYIEAFDRENVTLVEVNKTPIERFTQDGVVVGGKRIPLDTIIFATGFDVGTGAMSKIDIRGRGGRRLADHWRNGYRCWLGMMSAGFPNMFWVQGPGYAFSNGFTIAEIQGDWIVGCMDVARERGLERVEPSEQAETAWMDHHEEVGNQTLFPQGNSYYMGDNIPGKPRVLLFYLGGLPQYRERCAAVAANGYRELRS